MMHQAVKQKYLVLEHRNTCVSYNSIISTRFSEQFHHQMFPKTIFSTETGVLAGRLLSADIFMVSIFIRQQYFVEPIHKVWISMFLNT